MNVQARAREYLELFFEPLAPYLCQTDVTDLVINRPGEVWLERQGSVFERIADERLTEDHLWRLARQIAAATHQGLGREQPLLSARLTDDIRVQIACPPATRETIAFSFRKHSAAELDIDAFSSISSSPSSASYVSSEQHLSDNLRATFQRSDWPAFLRLAATGRLTMLISGGTSTGKTTFLNALLREVDLAERIVLIEDAPEISLKQENSVGLVASRSRWAEAEVTTDDLLIAALRMRPDRIIVGEIRGAEALTFLRAVNTGHAGSLSTIHANSAKQAVEQLVLMCANAGSRLSRRDIAAYIRSTIDVFVHLKRKDGHRTIDHVDWAGSPTSSAS